MRLAAEQPSDVLLEIHAAVLRRSSGAFGIMRNPLALGLKPRGYHCNAAPQRIAIELLLNDRIRGDSR